MNRTTSRGLATGALVPTACFLGFIALPTHASGSGLTPEQTAFFEAKIRPVLIESCYECHSTSADKKKGGLVVDSRGALQQGGDTGPAVVPGDLHGSLLWTAVSYEDPDYEMPPDGKLPADVVEDFRRWILMGAPDPRDGEGMEPRGEIDIEEGRNFWAFQEPVLPNPPEVGSEEWMGSDIDRFALAKLEAEGLEPAPAADPATLLRRLTFDLTGLPPTPEEVVAFIKAWQETPEEAYALAVEDLLDRPQFGERWGRHWLDVARYAESSGKESNATFPHAWRYRDYVIDAFNEDKPYDRFLMEQIAGDLLPVKSDSQWQENLIATGFLALGPKSLPQRNPLLFQMDLVDEQIDTLTQSMLGLTVACARCHDHKFDPIPAADYYAMAGIFLSTETYFGTVSGVQNRRATELIRLPLEDEQHARSGLSPERVAQLKRQIEEAETGLAELRREAFQARFAQRSNMAMEPGAGGASNDNGDLQRQVLRATARLSNLKAQLNGVSEDGTPHTLAMGVQEAFRPRDARLLGRGEVDKPGPVVPRGFVQVLDHPETPEIPRDSSGRLELAQWVASPRHPLTARVMANRIWAHLFGKGLVGTLDNFGATGQVPTHPELLDHLALSFVEQGWSVKALIREIVHSQTYRLSATFDSSNYVEDPDNQFLWRANTRRLEAEAIRDAMLSASGLLDRARPLGSPVARVGDTNVGVRVGASQLQPPSRHRSVYLPIVRDLVPESLSLFDFAEPSMVMGVRETTNVPSQALYLMNNDTVAAQAEAFGRMLMERFETPRQRVRYAFLRTYGRLPTDEEIESCIRFFGRFMPAAGRKTESREEAERLAMTAFCQALFSSAEFRYLN